MTQTPNIVPDFTALHMTIVGDLIADHYLRACPTRLSREAPVMVLRYSGEEIGAGGAANVARNMWALGARTQLMGVVGRDANGRELLRILESEEIGVDGVHAIGDWVTPSKTRVLGAEPGRTPQQVLRIDREPDHPLAQGIKRQIAAQLRSQVGSIQGLLLSDYGYGLVGEEIAEVAREIQAAGAVVVLDPRVNYELFGGVTAMTPNLEELASVTSRSLDEVADRAGIDRAAADFRERYRPENLLVTLGNRGMVLYTDEFPGGVSVPASGSEEVVDVSGAGDTAAVAFTLALAAGVDGPRAMRLANAAASVVVMESGAAVCSLSKLRSMLPQSPQPAIESASAVGG